MKAWRSFLHVQQRDATCAVASIRTVLHRQFGLRVAETALVALGTSPEAPILREGTAMSQMRTIVKRASAAFNHGPPWTVWNRRRGTLKMLQAAVRRGRWPILIVFLRDYQDHHALVVLDVTADKVVFFDPDPAYKRRPRTLSRAEFLELWTDPHDGTTWMAVVNGGTLIDL